MKEVSSTTPAVRPKRRRSAAVTKTEPLDIWSLEEQEAANRDPEKDLQFFKQACGNVRRLMKEIYDLKKSNVSGSEITERRIQASLLFATMKKLNRLEKVRNKKARDATNETKLKVDTHHLQLQNLRYEMTHLTKEVNKCMEFKSKDTEIELISEEEFYKEAPVSLSKPEETKNDSHKLNLARLEWELEQRKRLAEKCQEAEANKNSMSLDIKSKKEYLEALSPCLNAILKSTAPVQEQLGMRHEMKLVQNKTAHFLPIPLFILYVQASAYAEAWDKKMQVIVEGDLDEAKAMKDLGDNRDEDSGDSDQEESQGNKRYRRSTTDRLAEIRKKVLQKHPLQVAITLEFQSEDCSLKLNFAYLVELHIVTVTSSLKTSTPLSVSSTRDLLASDILLNCLFPGDTGCDTPNQANHYQLRKRGMDDFKTYLSELNYPYVWAQRLAGLEFVNCQEKEGGGAATNPMTPSTSASSSSYYSPSAASSKVSATHMERTMEAIKERILSRIYLQKCLHQLEQGIVPVPSEVLAKFPAKINARLVSFVSLPFEDFQACHETQRLFECGLVDPNYMTFKATLERGSSAKLVALVALSPHYPNVAPIFVVNIAWKQNKNSTQDAALWDMEKEVNVFCEELLVGNSIQLRSALLANQIQRLLMCFDVYLETEALNNSNSSGGNEDTVEGPKEFAKEKMFFQQCKGRNRTKPYKYIWQQGLFVHR